LPTICGLNKINWIRRSRHTLVDPLGLRIIENIRLLTAADVDLLNVVVGQDLGDC